MTHRFDEQPHRYSHQERSDHDTDCVSKLWFLPVQQGGGLLTHVLYSWGQRETRRESRRQGVPHPWQHTHRHGH